MDKRRGMDSVSSPRGFTSSAYRSSVLRRTKQAFRAAFFRPPPAPRSPPFLQSRCTATTTGPHNPITPAPSSRPSPNARSPA